MEEGLSSTKTSYEAGKQPKKGERNGNGNYCCVPNCKSTQYKVNNKTKIKTGIGFFIFVNPKKEESMSRFHRRGGKDKFNANNSLILNQVKKTYPWDRIKKRSNVMWLPYSKT